MISLRRLGLGLSFAVAVSLSAGALFAAGAAAEPVVGTPAPTFTGTTSTGEPFDLADYADKTVVLEWTNHDCPYVQKHYTKSDNLPALQTKWAEDTVWVQVISSAEGKQGYVSGDRADAIAAERGAALDAIILDPQGAIGRMYDARTTPHMFVIEQGQLAYAGAIDDHPTARTSGLNEATNYVDDALTALATGEPVAQTATRAYGCTIKY